MKIILLFFVISLHPAYTQAYDNTHDNDIDERKVYDVISYVTAGVQIGADTIHSITSNDKKKEIKQQLIRDGITIGVSELLKRTVHKSRPDGSDNMSFPSEHTSLTAASQGWNFYIGIPLTGVTGFGRVKAKKHYILDVLVGAGIGSLVERFVH